jgi:hypothetical protein
MSKVAIEGNASGTGTFTIAAPNSNSNYTLTLPESSGTLVVGGGVEVGTLQQFYKSDFITPDATFPDSTWLKADGSVVSQATYPDLFDKVGLQPDGLDNFEVVAPTTLLSIAATMSTVFHYGESLYLVGGVSGQLATSTDSITWTTRTSGLTFQINDLTSGNSLYVYGASNGSIRTSTDGITWTARTSGVAVAISALTFGDNLYVYGAANGNIRSSTNGITWTARTSGTTFQIKGLAYGNGLFAYGDDNGDIRTSTDAITWDARTSNLQAGVTSLIYGDGVFVASTPFNNTISTSTDGITWVAQTVNATLGRLAYSDGVYLATSGNEGRSFFTSTDAINWRQLPGIAFGGGVGAGNGRYLLAGTIFGGIRSAPKYTYNTATEFALPLVPYDSFYDGGAVDTSKSQFATYIKATT